MTNIVKALLSAASVIMVVWILRQIRRLRVKMDDAIYWIFFAAVLILMAFVSKITYWIRDLLGIQSPANLVFLVIIGLLAEKIFTLSLQISSLQEKVSVLSAEIAVRSHASQKEYEMLKNEILKNGTQRDEIAETQRGEIPETQRGEIPETQRDEIAETQRDEIPETQRESQK